jgi:hypothetical protein
VRTRRAIAGGRVPDALVSSAPVPPSVRFVYAVSATLPPLAWAAHVADGSVSVHCGASVRRDPSGFVEGTWVGPSDLAAVPRSTTVFGSGMFADGDDLLVVPPSHPCERVYMSPSPTARGGTLVSNSLVALLVAADAELAPNTLYPPIFRTTADGIARSMPPVPTTTVAVTGAAYHNYRLRRDGTTVTEERPRERPFDSFEDYRERLTAALASAVANAPGYEMVVSISSGYDSTAVAAVAARVGCRRAVTLREGKPVRGSASLADSGEDAARRLGMAVQAHDRLDYLRRDDLPEAEFLSTGMTGEDVVASAMETALRRTILLTGTEAFPLKGYPVRHGLYRADLSGCSLTEFRVRVDFVHLPALFFGASEDRSLIAIATSAEMRPWTVPERYDKPIQRRLAEEAGVPRGTFATVKRRASASIHVHGLAAMAPMSRAAVSDFAQAEGRTVPSGRRPLIRRRHRLVLRLARALHVNQLVAPLERRRRSLIHAEPALGSLLFRWGVSVVRARYADLAGCFGPSSPTAPPSGSR